MIRISRTRTQSTVVDGYGLVSYGLGCPDLEGEADEGLLRPLPVSVGDLVARGAPRASVDAHLALLDTLADMDVLDDRGVHVVSHPRDWTEAPGGATSGVSDEYAAEVVCLLESEESR